MVKWKEGHQMFHAVGFPMPQAAFVPNTGWSYILPNQEENSLKIPRWRIRCTHVSIDSIPGKEIDIGDIDSVEPSLSMVST